MLDEQCETQELKVVQSLGAGCDEAAIEVVKEYLQKAELLRRRLQKLQRDNNH